MNLMMTRTTRNTTRAGFTLVELMVAMLLTGILSVVIYSLFDTTSDNFREVDNLADTNSRLRFAMERLRNDIQMAGAQVSPDSTMDDAVEPQVSGYRVAGIMPYTVGDGWQDTTPHLAAVSDANPHSTMDGVVILGAYDYPLSFEMAGLIDDGSGNLEGHILAHYRGLLRLTSPDPFYTRLTYREDLQDNDESFALEPLEDQWATRLFRVSDQQGFMQFIRISGEITLSEDWENRADDFNILHVPIPPASAPLGPKFKDASNAGDGGDFGLDELPEGDTGYDTALVDAFWYHVRQDPQNPNNLQLVRERLCAPDAVVAFETPGSFDPNDHLAEDCPGGDEELVVIADNVADFQLWFDCSNSDGDVVGSTWDINWDAPNPENDTACVSVATNQIGLARVAHIRLSLHAENERKDQRHIQFESRTGALCDPDDPAACAGVDPGAATLRTYDVYPTVDGAARVVTLQSDVELTNFAVRNAVGRTP
jgi:prepilin-type N-terminal cleavage/methylation domain-containing protein